MTQQEFIDIKEALRNQFPDVDDAVLVYASSCFDQGKRRKGAIATITTLIQSATADDRDSVEARVQESISLAFPKQSNECSAEGVVGVEEEDDDEEEERQQKEMESRDRRPLELLPFGKKCAVSWESIPEVVLHQILGEYASLVDLM